MDKVKKYRQIAKNIIIAIGERKNKMNKQSIHYQIIIDDESGNYLLIRNGWRGATRFYSNLIHIEVTSEGKVWLHQDNTDLIIADSLIEQGIPENVIIYGFHAPAARELVETEKL